MSNPFDYATAILQTKKQMIVDDITEKEDVKDEKNEWNGRDKRRRHQGTD